VGVLEGLGLLSEHGGHEKAVLEFLHRFEISMPFRRETYWIGLEQMF
jgi:hypothetical protein